VSASNQVGEVWRQHDARARCQRRRRIGDQSVCGVGGSGCGVGENE
jgi:hypothetical protein